MKNGLIIFKSANDELCGEYIDGITSDFNSSGFNFDFTEVLSDKDGIYFKHFFERIEDACDNLVVVGGEKAEFDVKEVIASASGTKLLLNEKAEDFIRAVLTEKTKKIVPPTLICPKAH